MAVSKNNRKRGKKRSSSHAAPPGFSANTEKQPKKRTMTEERRASAVTFLKAISLVLMIAGLGMVYFSHDSVGFPLAIAGAFIGFVFARQNQHFRFVTSACYGIFIAVMIYYWISFT